mgnify:FL=1|jgi:hypothetical protein
MVLVAVKMLQTLGESKTNSYIINFLHYFIRSSLSLVVLFSLSGCFGGGQWMTRSHYLAPDSEHRDCKNYGKSKYNEMTKDAYDESSAYAGVLMGWVAADAYTDICMEDKGYVWVD